MQWQPVNTMFLKRRFIMTKNKSTLKFLAGLTALVAASMRIINFASDNGSMMVGLFATSLLWITVIAVASEQKTEQVKVESGEEVRNK